MPRQPTRDDVIKDMVKTFNNIDGKLTQEEYKEHGEYNPISAKTHFGTWEEAKNFAALPSATTERGPDAERYTNEELLDDLKDAAEQVEGALTQKEYLEHGSHSPATFHNRFGGFNEAKQVAGLEETNTEKKISDAELLNELNQGKSYTQIADEYGYQGISTISQRAKRLGWDIRNKVSKPSSDSNNGMIINLKEKDLEEAGFDTDKPIYFNKEVKDGKVVLNFTHERVDTE